MLVLTRKPKQKIHIGNDIVITILKVQGDQVSIGVEAPKELSIVRDELIDGELAQTAAEQNRKSVIDANDKPSLIKLTSQFD